MPENIIAIMNKIAEEQGETYAQVLVDGINIGLTLATIGNKIEPAREST